MCIRYLQGIGIPVYIPKPRVPKKLIAYGIIATVCTRYVVKKYRVNKNLKKITAKREEITKRKGDLERR